MTASKFSITKPSDAIGGVVLKGNVFRILALSGGGVRGLFQAHFLERLEKEIGAPLSTLFDLCVGTSIGSVSAGAVAVGISAGETLELYNNHVSKIFNIKPSRVMINAFLRKGPIFDRKPLDKAIGDLFGDRNFSNIETGFICTSGELSTYNHRIFSCFDKKRIQQNMLLRDAILSSCSAPIIFAPYRPKGESESFIDGGIWANSPTLIALQAANLKLGIPISQIEIVSVGTGMIPKGSFESHLLNARAASWNTAFTLIDMYSSSQIDYFDESTESFLPKGKFISVNPVLKNNIPLYDFEAAQRFLPALAESEFEKVMRRHRDFFEPKPPFDYSKIIFHEPHLMDMIEISGLKRIMPSRAHYLTFREGSGNIVSYLGTAKTSIEMVSISLSTGMAFEQITNVLKDKLEKNDNFRVTISLINPKLEHLMKTVTSSVSQEHNDLTESQFSNEIQSRLDTLLRVRESWPKSSRNRFDVRVHDALPQGSAIILDRGEKTSVIQIETKPYKAPIAESYAIEVRPTEGDGLYEKFLKAYSALLADGKSLVEVLG